MDSALTIGLGSKLPFVSIPMALKTSKFQTRACIKIKAAASSSSDNAFLHSLKTTARTAVVFATVTTAAILTNFQRFPGRAEAPVSVIETETQEKIEEEKTEDLSSSSSSSSPVSEFLESNTEAIAAMKTLLQQKMEAGEDEESLKILKQLVSAQPEESEWKFLMARLLNEMGDAQEARNVFEEILAKNPLSFQALFENALLMDRCGEGEGVIKRLEKALEIAEVENKVKEARDIKLIIAQVQFLQKDVEAALRSYEELAKADPSDFRPYFCKGMIYSLMDRNSEARDQFARYRELSPKKFEVEGYLRSPLSRMKLFGTDDKE